MDKSIEIVLVAAVVLATAAIVLFLAQGKTGDFSDFLGQQSDGAECDLMLSKAKSQAKCDGDTVESKPDQPDKWNNLECEGKYKKEWPPEGGWCG